MKTGSLIKVFFYSIVFITLLNCSGAKEIQSVQSKEEIKIDGLQNEWEGKLNFDNKAKIAVGFQNDKDNIYLCITTNDRSNIMKIFRLGLTVWFEPQNGKRIGIKYPIIDMERMRDIPFRSGDPDNERENPDERFSKFISTQKELSIVNEDDYPLYLLDSNDPNNIQAKIEINKGSFVYELKIPFSTNKRAKYFIESAPSENIKIDIVTNEFKKESQMSRPGSGMNPGSGRQPGARDGNNRRQGGNPAERNFEMNPDPIKLKYAVKLSG
ncbi:MAG: hypothetical protein KGZ42_05175 [Melioribacter sp.]|nr:hypothetical protein [Melioribacter sp.]